jgi:large subunit ribosomal protein L10
MLASLQNAVFLLNAPLAQAARLVGALEAKAQQDPSILAGGAGTAPVEPAAEEAPEAAEESTTEESPAEETTEAEASSDEPSSDEPSSDEPSAETEDATEAEATEDAPEAAEETTEA